VTVEAVRKSCLRGTARAAVASAILAGCLAVVRPVSAQSSQAYLSLGAGATDLSGGADWLLFGTPVAVGGELGAGNLFVASLGASYQPFARQRQRKVHPFLQLSLAAVSSSPYSAWCVGFGGGLVYWPRSQRVGLRVEAAKLWPAFDEDPIPLDETFVPRLWTLRAGIAFGW
jgi:hypothetical protein